MATALIPLEKLQFGVESTPGTLVAATRVYLAENGGAWTPEIDRQAVDETRGVLAMVEDVDVRKGSLLSVAGNLDFEQIELALQTGIKSVSPSGSGPYTREWLPSLTAPETLKAATFEVAYRDGASKHVEKEFGFGTCSKFSIATAFNQPAKLQADFFARAPQSSTFTTGQSAMAREVIPSNKFGLWIDSSWAGLGTTQKSGLLRSSNLEVVTGAEPDYTHDARADLDFSQLMRGLITGRLNVTCSVNGDFATEYAAWESGALRFARLKALGSGSRSFIVDVAGRYTAPPRFGNQGRLRTAELQLEFRQDPTSGNIIRFEVINSISAL